jgi:squalene cyclase
MPRLRRLIFVLLTPCLLAAMAYCAQGAKPDEKVQRTISRGLDWLASQQSRAGHWGGADGQYPTAMTALSGMAFLQEGSTSTQGKYAKVIRQAVNYLLEHHRKNGLIGDPTKDDRYTYGHGYAMLFLSQVLGEEEDEVQRKELVEVLTSAVSFTGQAQTPAGGWGYVSAKDGNDFDEGSTTITQVQALRGCRNAGIPVPKEIIDRAIQYIRKCTTDDGGVQYSSTHKGPGRPAITAAAVACLFNAGEYDDKYVPKLLKYCKAQLGDVHNEESGHWHYAHYYYSQVRYREGGESWDTYFKDVQDKILRDAKDNGKYVYWDQNSYVGPVYTTAVNLTILQLENGALPIYQR